MMLTFFLHLLHPQKELVWEAGGGLAHSTAQPRAAREMLWQLEASGWGFLALEMLSSPWSWS